jgi:hypothetical protein
MQLPSASINVLEIVRLRRAKESGIQSVGEMLQGKSTRENVGCRSTPHVAPEVLRNSVAKKTPREPSTSDEVSDFPVPGRSERVLSPPPPLREEAPLSMSDMEVQEEGDSHSRRQDVSSEDIAPKVPSIRQEDLTGEPPKQIVKRSLDHSNIMTTSNKTVKTSDDVLDCGNEVRPTNNAPDAVRKVRKRRKDLADNVSPVAMH